MEKSYSEEDLRVAWTEGFVRASWEEGNMGNIPEPPKDFPSFLYKHHPEVTTYQYTLTYSISLPPIPPSDLVQEVIVAGNDVDAKAHAESLLRERRVFPSVMRLEKVI